MRNRLRNRQRVLTGAKHNSDRGGIAVRRIEAMYGESKSVAAGYVNPRSVERHDLTPTSCGAYRVGLTNNFPATCIDALVPLNGGKFLVRTALDLNADGIRDVEVINDVTFHDDNGNGCVDRNEDSLCIRPVTVNLMQRVPLRFVQATAEEAVRTVVVKLGGNPGDIVEPEEDGERWDGQSAR